jgi:hypothetical protein
VRTALRVVDRFAVSLVVAFFGAARVGRRRAGVGVARRRALEEVVPAPAAGSGSGGTAARVGAVSTGDGGAAVTGEAVARCPARQAAMVSAPSP